jgi:hypothetical protein
MFLSAAKANADYPTGTRNLIAVFIAVSRAGSQKHCYSRFTAVHQFHNRPSEIASPT